MPFTLGVVASAYDFLPTKISNLIVWLDAADTGTITASSGLVSQWNDKSGNSNHVVQATGSAQPTTGTRTINNLNAIDFTRTADRLVKSGLNINQPFTIFGVSLADSVPGTANRYFDGYEGITAGRARLPINSGTWRPNAGTSANSTRAVTTGTAKQQTVIYNGSSSSFYENRIQYGGTLNVNTGAIKNLNISTDNVSIDANSRWDGLIGEFILYSKVLSASERAEVEDYLAAKWGTI